MAGIYIHIPFCKKACNYCNFHFSVNNQLMPEMVDAIAIEAKLHQHYLKESIETIYIGGGTPSLLNNSQLNKLFRVLKELFELEPSIEITLEANPDDINEEKLALWKSVGINRLSIGVQSFFEEDLQWMNRAHNVGQAIESIQLAQKAGFDNISIDLIYGGPTLTDEHWIQNLETCFRLNIPHLSAYALTVEPKTALAQKIKTRLLPDIDPAKQASHFNTLVSLTSNAGLEQYEISNFAIAGKKSRHNSNYWASKHYLGLGPAAHSFNGNSRQWNVANNSLYLTAIQKDTIPFEIEFLTPVQQLNEYIMTALRTSEGINLNKIQLIGGDTARIRLIEEAQKFLIIDKMKRNEQNLLLTNEGKFFADGIAAELFQL